MRHFVLPLAVAALASGVRQPPLATVLIAHPGGLQAGVAGALRTAFPAITLATIAVAADQHGGATARAEVASSASFHGPIGPWGLDGRRRFVKDLARNVPVVRRGARHWG